MTYNISFKQQMSMTCRCLIPQCEDLNSTNYNYIDNLNYTYKSYVMPEKSCSRLQFDGNCKEFLTFKVGMQI